MQLDLTGYAVHAAPAALLFARFVGMFVAAPVINGGYVPLKVKALLAMALTLLVLPLVRPALASDLGTLAYALLIVKELAVGLTLGFFLLLFFIAVRFGGDIIGRGAGFAAAEIFNPDTSSRNGPIGQFFFLLFALLFVYADGHLQIIACLCTSFEVVPVGSFEPGPYLGRAVAQGCDQLYRVALALALPFQGALLAITVSEGVIARAVPQINILHITFATKILSTMTMLVISLPLAVTFLGVVLGMAYDFVGGLMRAMGA